MKKSIFVKSLLSAMLVVLFATQAFGQITTGTPVSRNIPTGNRPEAGDWGIFIGPSVNEIADLLSKQSSINTWLMVPLVNVKYYTSDNFEIRGGLQISSISYKTKGTILDDKDELSKQHEAYYRIYPGIAYHFSPNNILDVYMGAQIPFGLSVAKDKYMYDGKNYGTTQRTSFEIGLGAFIGIQCFIADLPVAIGLEYGFSGVKYFGQKYKNITTDQEGNEQTFYTTENSDKQYSKLKSSKGYFGSDLRVTLSYFFN
jgi:hypothetical protein